jgi:plastocyanin
VNAWKHLSRPSKEGDFVVNIVKKVCGCSAAGMASLLLAGCGGSAPSSSATSSPSAATGHSVTVEEYEMYFDPGKATLAAGAETITVKNEGRLRHDLHVTDASGKELGHTSGLLDTGQQQSIQVTLSPGTYAIFCAVDDHRQDGMQGTITVK